MNCKNIYCQQYNLGKPYNCSLTSNVHLCPTNDLFIKNFNSIPQQQSDYREFILLLAKNLDNITDVLRKYAKRLNNTKDNNG